MDGKAVDGVFRRARRKEDDALRRELAHLGRNANAVDIFFEQDVEEDDLGRTRAERFEERGRVAIRAHTEDFLMLFRHPILDEPFEACAGLEIVVENHDPHVFHRLPLPSLFSPGHCAESSRITDERNASPSASKRAVPPCASAMSAMERRPMPCWPPRFDEW